MGLSNVVVDIVVADVVVVVVVDVVDVVVTTVDALVVAVNDVVIEAGGVYSIVNNVIVVEDSVEAVEAVEVVVVEVVFVVEVDVVEEVVGKDFVVMLHFRRTLESCHVSHS